MTPTQTSKTRTGRASRDCAIFASTAVGSDIVARTTVAAQKAASKVKEFTNNNSHLSLVGARRLELASNGAVHTVARVIIGSRGQGGAGELRIVLRRARGVGVGPRGWAVWWRDFAVLVLQVIEIFACSNGVAINGDHAELTLARFSREITEGQCTRPDISHRRSKDGLYFNERARRGQAAEFGKVCSNIVVRKEGVLACVYTCGVRTTFAMRDEF